MIKRKVLTLRKMPNGKLLADYRPNENNNDRKRLVVPDEIYQHIKSEPLRKLSIMTWICNIDQYELPKPKPEKKTAALTLDQFMPQYWQSCLRHSDYTIDQYQKVYTKHIKPLLGNIALTDFGVDHGELLKAQVRTTINQNGKLNSKQYVNYVLRLLKIILTAAHDRNLINFVPRFDFEREQRKSKKIRDEQFWTDAQANAIINAALTIDPMIWLAMLLGIDAGLRVGEACSLNWADVDFRRNQININRQVCSVNNARNTTKLPKGESTRSVPMTDRLREALEQHKSDGQILSADGLTVTKNMIFKWMLRATSKAAKSHPELAIKVCGTYHRNRHTLPTRLHRAGVHINDIKEIMGHANINTTARYIHSTDSDLQSSIARLN